MIRGISGCEPGKSKKTNVLVFQPGEIWSSDGETPFRFETSFEVAVTPSAGDHFLYLISNEIEYYLIDSQSKFSGGVVCPPGFSVQRKLPFGFVWNSAWDGIPAFHLAHWPSPLITFTDSEASGLWSPLIAGHATTWTDLDLSPWVPDDARFVYLSTRTIYNGASSSTYLRSHSGQITGKRVGSVSALSAYDSNRVGIRITSDRKIQYRSLGGAGLDLFVEGYAMTEPA